MHQIPARPFFFLRRARCSPRRALVPAALLAFAAALALASPASPQASALSQENAITPARHEQPVLFADEIIRRLRRIGINVNKTRLPHPYDPDDGVC